MSAKAVVIVGNLGEGFSVFGPFDDFDLAAEWSGRECGSDAWIMGITDYKEPVQSIAGRCGCGKMETDENGVCTCENPNNEEITLKLKVLYKMNGESKETLICHLNDMVERAIGDGLLTGATTTEVENYETEIR